MMHSISVNGFRSLTNFQVTLQPGLNVAVGPNGAGKTNFISFLDFASRLVRGGLEDAFLSAGGASAVFSKENLPKKSSSLSFSISGFINESDYEAFYLRPVAGSIGYEYQCRIVYRASSGEAYIHSEKLRLAVGTHRPIAISRSTGPFPERIAKISCPATANPVMAKLIRHRFIDDPLEETIQQNLARSLASGETILSGMRLSGGIIEAVRYDFGRIQIININPTVAKASSPIGTFHNIRGDGGGLAGVLYNMKNKRGSRRFRSGVNGKDRRGDLFESVVAWVREANTGIMDIRPVLSLKDAEITLYADLDVVKDIAFKSLSDGTAKWAALVALLSVAEPLQVIEEPENFLHPRMQELFLALCRERVKQRGDTFCLLITTHSETILNDCHPGELIMFESGRGGTRCARPVNAEQVADQIRKTDFKLGHFYRVGALDGGE